MKESFMRKSMFFTIALSFGLVCFGADAAPNARTSRGQAATRAPAQTNVEVGRAGKVQNVKQSANSARAATNVGAKKVTTARAGATQKVINTGTKVASATTNTNVPEECQNAFYGCMDAFCMLDNASGGRCQCSDRIVELDSALEDILKLDEQTYLMATEGVERIQMGEAEEQVMARVKAAAEKTVSQDKEDNKKKARTLDLSAWNNTIFNEVDDLFESSSSADSISTFADKKGDDLYKASARMCAAQIPESCQTYGSMMQLIYAQKIKSDCVAYENSLKAQKAQSQQKLQTAQKALREAALDEYKNQNKYSTTGECVVAFTQCMQVTAECGDDYTGCVTLAAKENVKGNASGKKAKQTTIKGSVAGSDITLAASTMEQLAAKKIMCEHITKQCVNSNRNDAVWKAFLRNAAPALKSAEDIAEQRLRMECIPNMAKCFQDACKSNFGEGDSYDMCLSNPKTYKSLCKVQLEPCLEATGGTYESPENSTLWNGLVAMLNAMKVDACTKEVKACLTSENACGEDYSACIGLTTQAIVDMCPTDKLTACMSADENGAGLRGADDVRNYVAQIAQGLALQIDNSMMLTCQAALDTAMINACGDTASCPKATVSANAITDLLGVQICKEPDPENPNEKQECHDDPYAFTKNDILGGHVGVYITNRPKLASIDYTSEALSSTTVSGSNSTTSGNLFTVSESVASDVPTTKMRDILNAAWNAKVAQIESDPKVEACIKGRPVQKYTRSGASADSGTTQGRFKNLTQTARMAIADDLMNRLWESYDDVVTKLNKEQVPALAQKLADVIAQEAGNKEAGIDSVNEQRCKIYEAFSQTQPSIHGCQESYKTVTAEYDSASNICTVTTTEYERRWYGDKKKDKCRCGAACKFVPKDNPEVETKQMSTYSRFDN